MKKDISWKVGDLWQVDPSITENRPLVFRITEITDRGIESVCMIPNKMWTRGQNTFDRWSDIVIFHEAPRISVFEQ